jgi:transcriptional regulator with XRE-family HTH domain
MNKQVIDKLNEACSYKFHDNQSDMADALGMKQGTLSKILRHKVDVPSRRHGIAIAQYLNISIDEVYGDTTNYQHSSRIPSDPTLSELITIYHALDDTQKGKLIEYARDRKALSEYSKAHSDGIQFKKTRQKG